MPLRNSGWRVASARPAESDQLLAAPEPFVPLRQGRASVWPRIVSPPASGETVAAIAFDSPVACVVSNGVPSSNIEKLASSSRSIRMPSCSPSAPMAQI
jgi:hypothetical protein